MLKLRILRWVVLAAETWIAFPILYLCIVTVSAIKADKKRRATADTRVVEGEQTSCNFAILIPAHNEEIMLGTLLESLLRLEYPQEKYAIYVVADNCTDNTASLARAVKRIQVYERVDSINRGKGYALNWLLQKLEENQLIYDAYVFLDADSIVIPTFLQSMAKELAQGKEALQGYYGVLNAAESPSTALRWLALTLMEHVRPLGRNGLDASATLGGNGMCLSRNLLLRHPWRAFSVTEDYEYYLDLVEHGEKVWYVPEAIVRSHMPSTFAQMRTQDVRWESSDEKEKSWQIAWRLLRTGVKMHDFVRFEAAAELLTPPLSFLAGWCLCTFVAALLVRSRVGQLISFLLLGGLACYVGSAFRLAQPPRAIYKAFLYAPGFMLWKLWVYFVLTRSNKHTGEWVRTSRTLHS